MLFLLRNTTVEVDDRLGVVSAPGSREILSIFSLQKKCYFTHTVLSCMLMSSIPFPLFRF
jgi:hypothetical protein